jgi:hypothetical protein
LNQEDNNHLNRSIICNEIEAAIVSEKSNVQGLMESPLNSTKPLKKTFKFFHKIEHEGTLPSQSHSMKPVYCTHPQTGQEHNKKLINRITG